ncbi:MAG: phosphatidylserine decarboxylase family protein [Acidobacteria bacterium]|nr:phosphatidylserine decarboxylase family protein [Acidobacteriota bacterium]
MKIDRSGLPFVAGALLPAALLLFAKQPWWAAPFLVLGAFFLFFFRDPERRVPTDSHLVVSPADGRVVVAGVAEPEHAPPGEWQQISIFLSPLNVHVNRIPATGRVMRIEYQAGKFLPAYRTEAAVSNERNEIWIDHGGDMVVCRQVVGILARRLVCRLELGQEVALGQRFGIMKFGSRIDLFLPLNAVMKVRAGDHVRAGETVLATLP